MLQFLVELNLFHLIQIESVLAIGGAALVALSGPITNLVIAFIAFGVGVFSGVINNAGSVQPTIFGLIISTAVSVNLGFLFLICYQFRLWTDLEYYTP